MGVTLTHREMLVTAGCANQSLPSWVSGDILSSSGQGAQKKMLNEFPPSWVPGEMLSSSGQELRKNCWTNFLQFGFRVRDIELLRSGAQKNCWTNFFQVGFRVRHWAPQIRSSENSAARVPIVGWLHSRRLELSPGTRSRWKRGSASSWPCSSPFLPLRESSPAPDTC